jgi:hypothetical protein
MSRFLGGSPYAMVRDIAEGFHTVTARTFQGWGTSHLDQLSREIDRQLREIRGTQAPTDDLPAIQLRNRKLQRLNTALTVLRGSRQQRRGRRQ